MQIVVPRLPSTWPNRIARTRCQPFSTRHPSRSAARYPWGAHFAIPVSLLIDLRHDLVVEHLGIQDAIKGTILGRFTALVFLLVDGALVVVFEDSKHLLKFVQHLSLVADKSLDIVSKLYLDTVKMLVDEVDNTGWCHFNFSLLFDGKDLFQSRSLRLNIRHHNIFLAMLTKTTIMNDLLDVC